MGYKKTLLGLGLLLSGSISAQKITKLIIIDQEMSKPVNMALVSNKEAGLSLFSDENGIVNISSYDLQGKILEISGVGYHEQEEFNGLKINNETAYVYINSKSIMIDNLDLVSTPKNSIFHWMTAIDLKLKPINSAQEILRYVPGLFVGQHAGGGKSEQIFLRGFDIDHGTDVSLSVDGLPVNMVSHAHGQGYADLHFLIPESIQDVDFNKGPYFADKGNFATAGYVSFKTKDVLEKDFVKLEAGQYETYRGVLGFNLLPKNQLANQNLYLMTEANFTQGYFDHPQDFNRFNGILKYYGEVSKNQFLTAYVSGFSSQWNASGQIPQRAVDNGSIGWFGAIDPNEGGKTSRYNANIKLDSYLQNGGKWSNQFYYSKYDFDLYSNFTFFLNDQENGDQIKQKENRNIYGLNSSFEKNLDFGKVKSTINTGLQVRYDDVDDLELSHTKDRTIVLERFKYGNVQEANLGFFYSQKFSFPNGFSITPSLRYDYFNNQYDDFLTNEVYKSNSQIISPKLNINYNLNKQVDLYAYFGKGYHSNDTRVAVLQNGKKVLPPALGTDVGGIFKIGKKLLLQSAIWYLWLDQEFVYVGDEAVVEESGKTQRFGFDVSARYEIVKNLFADVNVNMSKPKSLEALSGENYIPLAPRFVSSGGISYKNSTGWNGSLSYRWMGDRPANEDNSVVAKGYFICDALINYSTKKWELGASIQNIFNKKWKETQFDTESLLANESEPVSEIHFTPGAPFLGKLMFTYYF